MKCRLRLKIIKGIVLAAVAVFGTATAHASVSSGSSSQYYRVVAPPRETHAVGEKDFGAVAAFLTKVTGHKFVYRQPSSWLQYQNWVWRNYGAVYFDGPHFVAWRLHNQGATLGPRLPQPQDWRIFTWAGNPHIKAISDAVGSIFCAPPPPNFGTLWAQTLFTNPSEQPYILNTKGWVNIYKAVVSRRCEIGIAPRITLNHMDPNHKRTTIILRSPHFPNQAFSLSSALPAALQQRIISVLLSPAGETVLTPLRKRFAAGRTFVAGSAEQYKDVDQGLDNYWNPIFGAEIKQDLEKTSSIQP